MLELLADALQRPHFDADELEGLRERRIEFIKAAKDSEPQSLIGSYGRALLFAAHPFGQPIGGSETEPGRAHARGRRQFYRSTSAPTG